MNVVGAGIGDVATGAAAAVGEDTVGEDTVGEDTGAKTGAVAGEVGAGTDVEVEPKAGVGAGTEDASVEAGTEAVPDSLEAIAAAAAESCVSGIVVFVAVGTVPAVSSPSSSNRSCSFFILVGLVSILSICMFRCVA